MTTQQVFDGDHSEHLFLRRASAISSAWWLMFGGIGLLTLAGCGMIFAIAMSLDQMSLHAVTTLPTIMGIGALTAAWTMAHTPKQVSVGPQGISVQDRKGDQSFPWSQIGWATVATGAMNMRRQLVIYDTSGKTLTRLSEAFVGFDELVELVQKRLARQANPVSDSIQVKKAHRSAALVMGTGILILGVSAGVAWMTYDEQRAALRLKQEGVKGDAEIVRRFLAPNGVTPRLEYRVTGKEGRTATRNAEVIRPYWDSLEGVSVVPVVYVAEEPSISRLAEGEREEKDFFKTPVGGYGLAAMASLLCMFLIGAGVLQWYGWDLDLDSKTGRFSVKRFGTGR